MVLHTEESISEKDRLKYELSKKEQIFRYHLLRWAVPGIFLVSSLICFLLFPFYPLVISLIIPFILAIIAYKFPALSLLIFSLLLIPSYVYQLGISHWVLIGLLLGYLLISAIATGKPGASAGAAIGGLSGVLMLTPYFYFSIPLLAVILLLRLEGRRTGSILGIITFLMIYLPFLLSSPLPEGNIVSLFTSVTCSLKPPLTYLNPSSIMDSLQGALNSNTFISSGFSAYFVDGFAGVAFIVIGFLSIGPAAFDVPRRWLKRKSATKFDFLHGIAPLVSLLATSLIFVILLEALKGSIIYSTGFSDEPMSLVYLFAFALVVGFICFGIEMWAQRRDIGIDARVDLSILVPELHQLSDKVEQRLKEIKASCFGIDLNDEKRILSRSEEEIPKNLKISPNTSLSRLNGMLSDFKKIESQLNGAYSSAEVKLSQYFKNSAKEYKSLVDEATSIGLEVPSYLPPEKDISYEETITEQSNLDNAFRELATKLLTRGESIIKVIVKEIEPKFSSVTMDVARGFIEQGEFPNAARTILDELQTVNDGIRILISKFTTRIIKSANSLKSVINCDIIPTFETMGDLDSAAKYQKYLATIDATVQSIEGTKRLSDILDTVKQGNQLTEIVKDIVSELHEKIRNFEENNDHRVPQGYNWGKDNQTISGLKGILDSLGNSTNKLTINDRVGAIEQAIEFIKRLTSTLREYALTNEFLINYSNIEYLLAEKLRDKESVNSSELPVKSKYAIKYLRLYTANHYGETEFDPETESIVHLR
jgi:hypothetical protein